MIWIILGFVTILAGFVVAALGSILGGLALMLGGIVLMMVNYVTMMRGRGEDPNQGTINGMNGQGKQQSETVKVNMPEPGEQSPEIWEKLEK